MSKLPTDEVTISRKNLQRIHDRNKELDKRNKELEEENYNLKNPITHTEKK